jgi:DNA-binding NtrC family response regulator
MTSANPAAPPRVAIVEDDAGQARQLGRILDLEGFSTRHFASPLAALAAWLQVPPDLVLSDLNMPDMDGIAFLEKMREAHPAVPVIMMTGFGSVDTAKQALKLGAHDYLLKPLDVDELLVTMRKVLQTRQLQQENVTLRKQLKTQYQFERAVGAAPAWRRVMETVDAVADSEATALILGESGTGKELVAEAIHARSARAAGPLIKVHCAALPESLLEAELFGHEKGAFTGAAALRKGRFEEADGGTLFLDEVGEIAAPVQVKLLRVLQQKTFERLGSGTTLRADFRLVAATNRDLQAEVKAGHFREDLYYRLNVIPIPLPPLRERREDIALLAQHFLAKANALHRKHVEGFSDAALDAMKAYGFPGNVRELENLIERCVVLCRGPRIEPGDLPEALRGMSAPAPAAEDGPLDRLWRGELNLDALERLIIEEAMRRSRGVQTEAARLLGISRRTLQYRLEKHGLPRPADD